MRRKRIKNPKNIREFLIDIFTRMPIISAWFFFMLGIIVTLYTIWVLTGGKGTM